MTTKMEQIEAKQKDSFKITETECQSIKKMSDDYLQTEYMFIGLHLIINKTEKMSKKLKKSYPAEFASYRFKLLEATKTRFLIASGYWSLNWSLKNTKLLLVLYLKQNLKKTLKHILIEN